MDYEQVFSLCSTLAMIGWLLLAVAPRWKYTRPVVQWGLIPLVLCVVYAIYIIKSMTGGGLDFNSFGSLAGVMALFQDPLAVLAGWVHYLAFDLWIGSWEVTDAHKHKIPHLIILPCLFLTFMMGPVGLLLYVIIRSIYTKKVAHENF